MSPITIPGKMTLAQEFTWNETVWNPSMIQTALWLDAADAITVTADGSNLISQVNDKSGNNRTFTATAGARPTYAANTLNGQAVFDFGGAQSLTSTASAATWNFLHNSTGSTHVAVWKAGNNSDPNAVMGLCGTAAGEVANIGLFTAFDDRTAVSRNNRISTSVANGIAIPDSRPIFNLSGDDAHPANTATIVVIRNDPSNAVAANRSFINVDGGTAIQNNTATFSPSTNDASFTLQIGTVGNGAAPLTGYIGEFIALTGAASTDTRQKTEGYLAHKWGLTANLPSDHPYKLVGPTP